MEHIFVAGAYFTTDKKDTDMYPLITNLLKNKFPTLKIIMPTDIEKYRADFIQNNPDASLKEINKAMVDYDLYLIKTAKILIVDVTNKSTGLGIELGTIVNDNKPLIFVAKEGSQISNMVYGAFPEMEINFYSNPEDLKEIINKINL